MERLKGRPIITGRVFDGTGPSKGPVHLAEVILSVMETQPASDEAVAKETGARETAKERSARERAASQGSPRVIDRIMTAEDGTFQFTRNLAPNVTYQVMATAFDMRSDVEEAKIEPGCEVCVSLPLALGLYIQPRSFARVGEKVEDITHGVVGGNIVAELRSSIRTDRVGNTHWVSGLGSSVRELGNDQAQYNLRRAGSMVIKAMLTDAVPNTFGAFAQAFAEKDVPVADPEVSMVGGKMGVALERTAVPPTLDQALWVAIRNRTRAMAFAPYADFIDRVMFGGDLESFGDPLLQRQQRELGSQLHGVGAYQLLKTATEVFLLLQVGVRVKPREFEYQRLFNSDDESRRLGETVKLDFVNDKLKEYLGTPPQLPYISRVIEAAFPEYLRGGLFCDRVVTARLAEPPLIELIWSYWHEEGMLVQTMNTINRRFQNIRARGDRDPLLHLELDPLRRVNNMIWGQIQDEANTLSVKRRALEYMHQYGLSMYGRAAATVRPADNRSKFLEAFHNLLHTASKFYREDNDTTVIADGYPLLNGLKEVHLVLAQGAHNQFGDLPWTARAEMLAYEWILARPEIREFLQSRIMVPYKEPWMPQVDTMKTIQGWSDVTVTHFRDLGVYGEQVLLSVRFGDWIDINDEDSAKNWARYWRPEIQAYLHAYRAVTGVDLTNPDTVDSTVPAVHLQRRLTLQQRVST